MSIEAGLKKTKHVATYNECHCQTPLSSIILFFIQASSEIYDVALKKVQSFVAGRILETKIAGKIAASLCRCLVKIRYIF